MNAAREWHLITSEYPPQPGGVSDFTAKGRLCAEENQYACMAVATEKLYWKRLDLSHVIARSRQVADWETTCVF